VRSENGKRKTENGLRIADCGLRIADCGLRIADCGFCDSTESSNSRKSKFSQILFSVFRTLFSECRGVAPVRPSRRRFLLRFIEKENGGGTFKKQ